MAGLRLFWVVSWFFVEIGALEVNLVRIYGTAE
jgi:hypothetical protein